MDLPATVCLPLVEEAVVEAAVAPLPELDAGGLDDESAPRLGPGHLAADEA